MFAAPSLEREWAPPLWEDGEGLPWNVWGRDDKLLLPLALPPSLLDSLLPALERESGEWTIADELRTSFKENASEEIGSICIILKEVGSGAAAE